MMRLRKNKDCILRNSKWETRRVHSERDEYDVNNVTQDYTFYHKIQKVKMGFALKKMRSGGALEPDGIPSEVWRRLGEARLRWLILVFNKISLIRKISKEWRMSILVPIYKNKCDIQSCNNYKEIKLISHTTKFWKMVIEYRLRRITSVSKKQFGLCQVDQLWK